RSGSRAGPDGHLPRAEPEATRARYFQMLDTIESLGRFPPPILDAVVPLFFRSGADLGGPLPTAFRRALEGFSTEQLRNAIVPLGRLIFGRPEALPRLAALDPDRTLLMCGALDIPRPPAETTRMAELIGCEQVIVPDAGHISNLEQPAFVTRALEAWLERQIGR
ncbi:alpha/beta fold hydrolase, partial [Mitsuaria sp. TWR114]|uniref:alpha/beta fold hydrolase n=1 Tax=Mitsuaria sp. TWR114 TaxID=2601731 RepID=UPI001C9A84E6